MFPTTFCCRLCFETQTELKALLNENGEHNKTYEIAAKYFDPMLLTTVICLECWRHIREFYEFQQSVLKAQENLNVEEIEEIKPLIKLEVVTIDEDVDNNLKEEINLPIFDSVDINDFNQHSSDDEIPLVECFPKEMREFEELRTINTINKNKNSNNNTTDLPTSKEEAINPLKNHNDGQCPYCPQKLRSFKNIPRHIKVLHPQQFVEFKKKRKKEVTKVKRVPEKKIIKSENDLYKCPHCQKKFKSKKNIPRHMKSYHPNEYAEYKDRTKSKVDVYSLLHGLEQCDSESKNEKSNDSFEEASPQPDLDNCGSESKNDKSNDTLEEASVQQKTQEYDAFIAKWKQELECNMCNNSFSNFHLLYMHFKHEHPDENCYIVCCENKLWSRPDIVEHIILHLNPSTFKCKICEKCCTTYSGLNKHIRNVHSEEVRERPFECDVCQKRFYKRDKLLVHVGIHSTERHHICKQCGKGVSTELLLKKHINNAHKKKRLCDHCGKSCANSHALRLHLLQHTGDNTSISPQFQCVECNSKFKSIGILDRHKQVFHNDGSTVYMCSECNKKCPTKSALYQHKRHLHGNPIKRAVESKFQCTICYKRFKYNQGLQEHASTHTGLALYLCPHCPTKFKQKKNIRRHIQTFHSEEFSNSNKQTFNIDEIVI